LDIGGGDAAALGTKGRAAAWVPGVAAAGTGVVAVFVHGNGPSAVMTPWRAGVVGLRYGMGGVASGNAASWTSSSTLSSAAVRFIRSRPQCVQRWISIHRCSPRTVTAIGSMPPGQPAFRSPGLLRSRCLDHRQLGQWLRWEVPGASSETSTPQCPHWNERGNDKSGDLSGQGSGTGQTSRLLSCLRQPAGQTDSDYHRRQRRAIRQANILSPETGGGGVSVGRCSPPWPWSEGSRTLASPSRWVDLQYSA